MINIWIPIIIGVILIIILVLWLNYEMDKSHNESLKRINKFFDGIKSFLFIGLGDRIFGALEQTELHDKDEETDNNDSNNHESINHDGTF